MSRRRWGIGTVAALGLWGGCGSLVVTDGEMEDGIRHAISQPGTPALEGVGRGHSSLHITLGHKDIKPEG